MSDAPFQLLPAVDVFDRRAEQVVHGADDPLTVAACWVAQGAAWVHLVDLDRARGGGGDAGFLGELVAALPVPVQLSGGLDSSAAVEEALGTGAARINLAATALRRPQWVAELVAEHGPRIAVGIDVDGQDVVARGTQERIGGLGEVLEGLLAALPGVTTGAFVVADASRDGRLTGADGELFGRMAGLLPAPVIASGGIAGLPDLHHLRSVGVAGAVLGAALYHHRLTLAQALEELR